MRRARSSFTAFEFYTFIKVKVTIPLWWKHTHTLHGQLANCALWWAMWCIMQAPLHDGDTQIWPYNLQLLYNAFYHKRKGGFDCRTWFACSFGLSDLTGDICQKSLLFQRSSKWSFSAFIIMSVCYEIRKVAISHLFTEFTTPISRVKYSYLVVNSNLLVTF